MLLHFFKCFKDYYYKITNMNSPTSNLLFSIQLLKNKLRNDHHELQGIRKDFALPISAIPEENNNNQFKIAKTCGKDCRQKLIDLRKKQQAQVHELTQSHDKEKQKIIQEYEDRVRQVQEELGKRVKQQEQYITTLEEQIANMSMYTDTLKNTFSNVVQDKNEQSPIEYFSKKKDSIASHPSDPTSRYIEEKDSRYEHIVNNLMRENTILMETVERLKMENRKLLIAYEQSTISKNDSKDDQSQNYSSVQQKININNGKQTKHNPIFKNKNRLKFSKISDGSSKIVDGKNSKDIMLNDENCDTSNYMSAPVSWDEDSIMSEDLKMRTIKHLISNGDTKQRQCEKYYQL